MRCLNTREILSNLMFLFKIEHAEGHGRTRRDAHGHESTDAGYALLRTAFEELFSASHVITVILFGL